jgi:hypothetical protein
MNAFYELIILMVLIYNMKEDYELIHGDVIVSNDILNCEY